MNKRIIRAMFLLVMLIIVSSNSGWFVPVVRAWTPVEGHVTQDTTWTLADSPYRAINDVIVDPTVLLTIEPGVEVQFADGFSLIIEGSLNATGTDGSEITFTSSNPSPSAGIWNTLDFKGSSDEVFILRHCVMLFATNSLTIEGSGRAAVEKSTISDSSQAGIYFVNAWTGQYLVKENTIKMNNIGIHASTGAANISASDNTIRLNSEDGISLGAVSNITFTSNIIGSNGGTGINIGGSASKATFTENHIISNGGTGINIGGSVSNTTFSGNTISSNGGSGININGVVSNTEFSDDEILSNHGNGLGISVDGDILNVTITGNAVSLNTANGISISTSGRGERSISKVTIVDSVISSNANDGIYVDAYGRYKGQLYNVNVSRNIMFNNGDDGIDLRSSHHPWYTGPSYLHDVKVSGNTVSRNDHKGVQVQSSGPLTNVTVLENLVYSNGHHGLYIYGVHQIDPFDVKMFNNSLSANDAGIMVAGSIKTIGENSSIAYNRYGVYYDSSTGNRMNYTDIYQNVYGMNVTNGAEVSAEYNYWGDSSGPYHTSINPEGKGNPVNGDGTDLDFYPWLTTPISHINEPPVANLQVDKATVKANETVTFDASGSTDDGRVDYHFFDFGDGTTSTWTSLSVVKHKYSSEGIYNASLVVQDDSGVKSKNTAKKTIVVSGRFPSLHVSMTLNATTVSSEGNVSIEVHVSNGTVAVDNASVQLVADKGGTFTNPSGYTNSTGDFTATYTALNVLEARNVRITVTASKTGYSDASDSEYVLVLPFGADWLHVSVTADPNTVQSGEISTIKVLVTDGTNPVSYATVALTSDNGTLSPSTGNTDSNGNFSSTFTAPSVTQQTIIILTAEATKTGYFSGQNQTVILVQAPTLSVTVTTNPTTLESGQTSDIAVRVTYDGDPVPDANVTLTSDQGGTFSQTNGTTDSTGYFRTTFTAPAVTTETTITITANATKVGYPSGEGQRQLTVNPPPGKGNLQIYVRDSDGNPVPEASVVSTSQPTGQSVLSKTTEADGYATFNNITEGSYTIQASKSGYITATKTETVTANQTTTDTIILNIESGFELWWILPVAIVLIIVIAASWLAVKRRGKER